MMNRILITGGPGTGKTSLINELKRNGYNCSDRKERNKMAKAIIGVMLSLIHI